MSDSGQPPGVTARQRGVSSLWSLVPGPWSLAVRSTRAQVGRNGARIEIAIPRHRRDPPALPVEVELVGIDPLRRELVRRGKLALVAAEHRRNVAVPEDLVRDFVLDEPGLHELRVGRVGVLLLRWG